MTSIVGVPNVFLEFGRLQIVTGFLNLKTY